MHKQNKELKSDILIMKQKRNVTKISPQKNYSAIWMNY